MPASRKSQSDGHAFALCSGKIWGAGTTFGKNDCECKAARDGHGFGRGIGTSLAIAKPQAARDSAPTIDNRSSLFLIGKSAPHAWNADA
jgi:hypothetical protein